MSQIRIVLSAADEAKIGAVFENAVQKMVWVWPSSCRMHSSQSDSQTGASDIQFGSRSLWIFLTTLFSGAKRMADECSWSGVSHIFEMFANRIRVASSRNSEMLRLLLFYEGLVQSVNNICQKTYVKKLFQCFHHCNSLPCPSDQTQCLHPV